MDNPYKDYTCPYCRERSLETVATAHYVRGFVLAYRVGWKKFPACVGCARTQLLKEAGLSALIGWFSITSLFLNPLFIAVLILKTPFVRADPAALDKFCAAAGIPRPGDGVDVLKVLYGLAAKMIAADGKIDQREITVAAELGARLSEGFEYGAFQEVVENHKSLPETRKYAAVLGQSLSPENKALVLRYLHAIATADGEVDESEAKLLEEIGEALGVEIQRTAEPPKAPAPTTQATA